MADHANPAPADTDRLAAAIRQTLASVPEVHRKAAFKHATDLVWRELIDQSEQAKVASREAGSAPGAKAAAAADVIRRST